MPDVLSQLRSTDDLPDLKLVTTLRRFQGLITDRYQLRTTLEAIRDELETATGTRRNSIARTLGHIDVALLKSEQEDLNQLATPSE